MKPVEKMNKEELIQELYSLSQSLQKTEARACALEHPKARTDERDDVELFLRDAYAAGSNAAHSRSLFTAMEYAEREAPRLRALLAIRP
jgi:hypothetical protein